VIALAATVAVAPPPRELVEQLYSSRFYPAWAYVLTSVTNLSPLAVGDFVLGVWWLSLAVVLALTVRQMNRIGLVRTGGKVVMHTAAFAATFYLLFLGTWGLNYSRMPLSQRLTFDEARITTTAKTQLLTLTAHRLNELAPRVDAVQPDEARNIDRLALSSARILRGLGVSAPIVPSRAKASVLDGFLRAASTPGLTYPLTHEVVLDSTLLPVERPFLLAHEWAHVAGVADEAEANFVAWLTCVASDDPFVQYAGWLALYSWIPKEAEEIPPLHERVQSDLRAIQERVNKERVPQVEKAQRDVYDQYLKSNRVVAGVESYGLFIRLILGTDLAPFGDLLESR
jgi:hypothetical protein